MNNPIRLSAVVSGLLFVIVSLVTPSNWYFELPLSPEVGVFPITGIMLFKTALFIEGVLLLAIGVAGWRYQQITAEDRLQNDTSVNIHPSLACIFAISGITVLAGGLRSLGLSQSLWLDEIVTINYTALSLREQLTVFLSPNNHLLNTLLIKCSLALFGESEWSVRLPAVIFGTATVPALYWLTRRSLGDWSALAASLLLAVSYHHIFFSQNARGYSAYIFFSLLATGLFIRGIRQDKWGVWLCYITAMLLSFTALMNSVFVLISHIAAAIVTLYLAERRGVNIWPSVRRLSLVFSLLGLLVFHLYAILIPQIYVVLGALYAEAGTGFSPFTLEFILELIGGVSAGFAGGALIAAIPFLFVAISGFVSFYKKDFLLTLLLLFPAIFTALYLIARDLTVSPRFFLFELILAMICAVCGAIALGNWLSEKMVSKRVGPAFVSVTMVLLLAVLSLASLKNYYTTPKQSFREAVEYIEHRKTDATSVIVLFTAEAGIAYYDARSSGDRDENLYFYIRDSDSFRDKLIELEGHSIYLISTFPRGFSISRPELSAELNSHWRPEKIFPATIGDGQIYVWVRKE
jgi:mannosyltransferase